MLEDVKSQSPHIRMFPTAEAVFAPDSAFLSQHLLPVVSVDLAAVNPEWSGWLPFVNPIEPYECYIGDGTEAFHNEYAKANVFCLRFNEQGQYEWLADKRYFLLEHHDASDAWQQEMVTELAKERVEAVKQLALTQARYQQHGKFFDNNRHSYSPADFDFASAEEDVVLDQIGGSVGCGNWEYPLSEYGMVEIIDDETTYMIAPNGKRAYFVAGADGYRFNQRGADWILLFYEPESRLAMFTFDWT